MAGKSHTLILGASYGSLLATKMLMAGHDTTLVCLPAEAEAINTDGVQVRMPIRGRDGLVEINSKDLPGTVKAAAPDAVDPNDFDLIGLAMQEPQYRSPGVNELLQRVAKSGKPCMSIMNMPPLPYIKRISGLDHDALRACYTDPTVWDAFTPGNVTLCSPDPQAFRPPEEPVNVLQVSLPTNFKVAAFDDDDATALLRTLQDDIMAVRMDVDGGATEIPVKLKLHDSLFVPLAKWAMLLTGNYRCVMDTDVRPIKEAVHSDIDASKAVYDWVKALCVEIGANEADLVPFEKYAAAAQGLAKPSSAARALAAGAPNIERVDKLVQLIGQQRGKSNPTVDATVATVDAWLKKNRASASA
ncbi:MAG: hypothetical protein AAFQ45_11810 [Pseudomonadota bacterium]